MCLGPSGSDINKNQAVSFATEAVDQDMHHACAASCKKDTNATETQMQMSYKAQ